MPKQARKSVKPRKKLYYPYRDYKLAQRILKIMTLEPYSSTKDIATKLGGKNNPYPQKRVNVTIGRLSDLDYCIEFGVVYSSNNSCIKCSKSNHFLIERSLLEQAKTSFQKSNNSKMKKIHGDHPFGDDIICNGCGCSIELLDNETYSILNEKRFMLSKNGLLHTFVLFSENKNFKIIQETNWPRVFFVSKLLLKKQQKDLVKDLFHQIKNEALYKPNLEPLAEQWLQEIIQNLKKIPIDKVRYLEPDDYSEIMRYDSTPPVSFLF